MKRKSRISRPLVAAGLLLILATDLRAQQGVALAKIVSLNRSGNWAEAAAVAQQRLNLQPPSKPTIERCGVRVALIYSRTRLRQNEPARDALAAFDAECGDIGLDSGTVAEVSELRRELATGTGIPSSGDSARAPAHGAAPDSFWRLGDPVALGVNKEALDRHRALCERTGADACLVVVKGRIVQEWYSTRYQLPMYAMSTTKSITSLLVGELIDDGRIRSLDEHVCRYLKLWCTGLRGEVTLGELLSMTAGFPRMGDAGVGSVSDKNQFVRHLSPMWEPGTHWAYSNEGVQLLSPILDQAAGEPIQDYAMERLFKPLDMRNTHLHLDVRHHAWTYADMETTPRDLARIGLLLLNKGMWEGRRIISRAWIDASIRPSQTLNPEYGLLWWLHDDPAGFAAHGHLDTSLHVFPELGLIVVRMQAKPKRGVAEGTYEQEALPIFKAMVSRPF